MILKKETPKKTTRPRKTKNESVKQTENQPVLGVIGNTVWILTNEEPTEREQTLTIDGFEKPFPIEWVEDRNAFLTELLIGYNLLENGDFSEDDKKSLKGWAIDRGQLSSAGIDLADEWQLTGGHTAFLLAAEDAPRPSFAVEQKIPVIADVEYKFSGYFATQRAEGLITLFYYDENHRVIGENKIYIANQTEYSGGTSLDNYALVESVFTPISGAKSLQFKIELGEQIDLTQANAYLFFTNLFLGTAPKENFTKYDLFSFGASEFYKKYAEKKYSSNGKFTIPKIDKKNFIIKLNYKNELFEIDLTNELKIIYFCLKLEKEQSSINFFLESHNLKEDIFPFELSLEKIHMLNPLENFQDITEALKAILFQSPIRKLRIYEEDLLNAKFYVKLAQHSEINQKYEQAIELYQLSILFYNTPIANEHLGNLALNAGKNYQALSHYKIALDLNTESVWVYKNLAEIQRLSDKNEEAIKTILDGINKYPSSKLLLSSFEEHIFSYWQTKEQEIEALAISQSRDKLIIEYERTVKFISCSYDDYFRRNSKIVFTGQLNPKRVLIIGLTSEAMPQCFRYRIEQKLEQLKYAGYEAETISWYEQEAALNLINFYDCIIFYRVPAFSNVLKLVEYAKYLGKITFYELDDLLFEPYSVPPIESYGGQISLSTYTNITKDIAATRAIASQCDYAIASTLPLLEKLASLTKTKMGYLHRNGLDKYNPKNNHSKGAKATVNLFYGSGTLAHNSDFIIEALPAISRIMREHKEVTLTIMGYLVLQNSFLVEFKSQIIQIPFCKDIEIYSAFLSASDINLAVLHNDDVAACKSEIKWLEAANFSIPSVVSKTKNYLDVINQGEDGFVVSSEEEWYSTLKKLVENSDLRKSIGHKACERVRAEYSISALAKNIDQIVKNAVLDRLENKQKTNKKKIAIVNVFFPPSSRGGATRVVTDEFELLQQHYGNEFELVVFTADTSSPKYYDYNVYLYNGVRVHQVTVAYTEHTSNLEHDEKVKDLFENFLILEQPDLVHFHCIQALTASIVKATLERKIPYLVTIHDAWWISDYQFLTDKNNKVYPEGHPDIFEKIDLPENVSLEQSIKRRSHLKNLLMQSNSVLVVSETFKNIYHKNGIINAITNKNGISNSVHWQTKETEYTEKVICALIGGMSPHKGFDIFREAVNQFNGSNLEMLVVDHSKESAYLVKVFWGNTAVTIVGHVNQEDIVNLYKKIDVLFAPSICPESFGLVTREAMACGCWIVASDIGAIGEDVAVTNGFKIAPTEKNLLVTLNKLNKNPKKYKGISKSSQIRYSSDQVGELVDIFRELS